MFRSMPILLMIMIVTMIFLNPYIPLYAQQLLYAVSLTVKSAIVFLLPLIIFSLLFKTMVMLSRRATAIILLILFCVICSNFTATFLSHYIGTWIYQIDMTIIQPQEAHALSPTWSWQLPKLIDNNKAMFGGIILGILFGNLIPQTAKKMADKLDWFAFKILKCFTCLIPIFVLGFIVKLQFDGVISTIIRDYASIFAIIALAQFSYIVLLYAFLNRFNIEATLSCIKHIFPAAVAGFSSMSSAAVMPLTIVGAAQNAKNKELARSVIPATVNIHLLGDCIAIPIFAYALMKSYAMPEPMLVSYLIFVVYFVLAKFSVAAVPGGGIIIMLPILENYLGFSSEMLSLITALYILFDPVITCANVLGNGAFSKLIDNITSFKLKKNVVVTHI